MPQILDLGENGIHELPDDATPEEIQSFSDGFNPKPQAKQDWAGLNTQKFESPYPESGQRHMFSQDPEAVLPVLNVIPATVGTALHKVGSGIYETGVKGFEKALGVPSSTEAEGEMSTESAIKTYPKPVQAGIKIGKGLAESSPQLAIAMANPVLGAAAFGSTPEGFDPKAAAIAAALPWLGAKAGLVTEGMALKAGVSSNEALQALNRIGGVSGAAGLIAADEAFRISKLPKEEQEQAWIDAAANVGSQFLLGGLGHMERPKVSQLASAIESAPIKPRATIDESAAIRSGLPPRATPEMLPELQRTSELVNRAIQEATQKIVEPGKVSALELLRRQAQDLIQVEGRIQKPETGFERPAEEVMRGRTLADKPLTPEVSNAPLQTKVEEVRQPEHQGTSEVGTPPEAVGSDSPASGGSAPKTEADLDAALQARGYGDIKRSKMTPEEKAAAAAEPIPTPEADAAAYWDMQDRLKAEKDPAKKMQLYQEFGLKSELIKNRNPKDSGNPPERAEAPKTLSEHIESGVAAIEKLQAKLRKGAQSGDTLMGVPLAIIDTALEAARLAMKSGKTVAQAIDIAYNHIKRNARNYDEANLRARLEQILRDEGISTPRAGIKIPDVAQINQAFEDAASKKSVVGKVKDAVGRVRDFFSINPIPKLTKSGVQDSATQHAYARMAVPRMVNDLLSKVFPDSFKDEKAMAKVMDIINKDNILGGYDEFNSRAAEALKNGDTAAARKWKEMADSVGSTQDIEKISKEVRDAKSDPLISGAIERWNEHVSPELDRLYNEVKGVDPELQREGRGREFGARVNLLPKSEEAQWQRIDDPNKPAPTPSSSNYRNPNAKRDKFDRAAKFTGEYSVDPAAILSNVLYPRWNEATKLRFYNDLVKNGSAVWAETGMEIPDTIKGESTKRLPVKVPETSKDGSTRQVEKTLIVPESLVSEIRGVLDTDLNLKQNPIAKALTQVQLLQLADATSHLKNIHSVIAGAQGTKALWSDIAKRFPLLSTGDAIVRIGRVASDIAQDSPAMRKELADMAKQGLLREHYPSTGIQKITKMQDLIHSVDTASRVVMNRFFDNLVQRGLVDNDMAQRRSFVNQIGEYNKRLMSPTMKTMGRMGLSPFIVAGRNFNRFSKRLITGSPGVKAADIGAATQMRLVNFAGLAAMVTIPAMINTLTTGSVWGRRGTPIGAVDLGGKEDDKGAHKVVDLLQLYGIRRGLRATGIQSVAEGIANGTAPSKIVDNAISDVVSTAAHPWLGPALGAGYSMLTGKRLDLRGGPTPFEARKVGSDESQYLENARVTLKNQNALIYAALKPLLEDEGETAKEFGQNFLSETFLKSPASAIGVRNVKPPELIEAQRLAASGEQMTKEQAERSKQKRGLAADVRENSDEARKKLASMVESGDLTKQAKTDIEKRAQLSKIQYTVEKYLTPKDALQVYRVASPENRDNLRKIIAVKIFNNQNLSDEEKAAAYQSIADTNKDDTMQYPPIKFSINRGNNSAHFLISSDLQQQYDALHQSILKKSLNALEAEPAWVNTPENQREHYQNVVKSRVTQFSKDQFFKANRSKMIPLQ